MLHENNSLFTILVGDIQRKSFSDYSSIELGEELSRSGEHG